jgi:hypothetical protein
MLFARYNLEHIVNASDKTGDHCRCVDLSGTAMSRPAPTLSNILSDMADIFARAARTRRPLAPDMLGELGSGLDELAAEARRLEGCAQELATLRDEAAPHPTNTVSRSPGPAKIIDLSEIFGRERALTVGRLIGPRGSLGGVVLPLPVVRIERHEDAASNEASAP